MVLIREPAFVLRNDGGPIAVGANPKRIAPFAAAADEHGTGWDASHSLVENLAHWAASDPLDGLGQGRRRAATVTRPARKRLAR
jgi:hypothetical protein